MPSPTTFTLKPDEALEQGIPRLLAEFATASRLLGRPTKRDHTDAVHEARLLIKRLRALLWFIRPSLSATARTSSQQHLRHAAKLLAPLRDAAVARETFEKLARKTSRQSDLKALDRVARTLELPPSAGLLLSQSMRQVTATLSLVRGEVKSIHQWPPISTRLDHALRQFRRAGKKARQTEKANDFHEWRKKAKRLLHLLQMFHPKPGESSVSNDFHQRLDRLQDTLGMAHDHVITLAALPSKSSRTTRRAAQLLEEREQHFETKAQKRARHLKRLP